MLQSSCILHFPATPLGKKKTRLWAYPSEESRISGVTPKHIRPTFTSNFCIWKRHKDGRAKTRCWRCGGKLGGKRNISPNLTKHNDASPGIQLSPVQWKYFIISEPGNKPNIYEMEKLTIPLNCKYLVLRQLLFSPNQVPLMFLK